MRFGPMTRVLAVTAAAAGLALGAVAPPPALADGPLSVKLALGSRCIDGHKPAQDPITVKLLRSDGALIQTRRDDTTLLEWHVCFSSSHVPVPGNRIRLIHWTLKRTVSVPDITVTPDRVSNVVRGHALAGKAIELEYQSCDALGRCIEVPSVTVTADSKGHYRRDLSPVDIDGSDIVRAFSTTSHADFFYRSGQAPWMTITSPGRYALSCLPAGTTTLRLVSSTGVLRARKTFHLRRGCGNVSGTFRKDGHAINNHVGDRITSDFASDAKMTWPGVSVAASGYTYSGRCFPDTDAYVTIPGVLSSSVGTDANGRFSVNGYTPIPSGSTVRIACESKRGDRVTASAKAT